MAWLEGESRRRRCRYRRGCYSVSSWNNGDAGTGDNDGVVHGGELQERSRIFHMQGACFAWPRQYYYHIFHIMRPRVCLLFHATTTSATTPVHGVKREIELGLGTAGLNVLSFIARAAAFYGSCAYRGQPPMKSLYAPIVSRRDRGRCDWSFARGEGSLRGGNEIFRRSLKFWAGWNIGIEKCVNHDVLNTRVRKGDGRRALWQSV